MIKGFMEFINRGNVVDLAVAVIIGAAFGAITTSLVDQVIMPVVGMLIGGVDFSELGFILANADAYSSVSEAVADGAPVIQLGSFLNTVINFLLIAFVVFIIVRAYTRMQEKFRRQEVATEPEAAVVASNEELLLAEIRDLLKGGASTKA